MGSDSGSRRIRATGAAPEQGEVTASRAQIEQWLRNTSPMVVDDAGFAYMHAASTIGTLRDALPSNATRLSQSWRGETSAEVQRALQMLHSTAEELVSTMEKMSEVLRWYGGVYLPEARRKIENLDNPGGAERTPNPEPGPAPTATPTATPTASGGSTPSPQEPSAGASPSASDIEDGTYAARQALRTLNAQILELNHRVPEAIFYDLPTVTIPEGGQVYPDVVYPDGDPYPNGRPGSEGGGPGAWTASGGAGAESGGRSSDSAGGSGGGAGASATGGGSRGGSVSTPGTEGTGPGAPGPDGSAPGGQDPGGPGTGGPGSDGPGGTGGQDPPTADGTGSGTDTGTGTGQNPQNDGTVPAVIDGTDGTPAGDPGSTEVASFIPQTPATVPVIQQSPVGPVGPVTTVVPPATSVPPVLGTPGVGAGAGAAVPPPNAATARGTMNGMPMVPFMGGGAGGESAQESERFSPLTEEQDVWGSRPDVTSALISGSAADHGKARHGDRT
ncbi:hypothetical protein ABZ260_36980 [Streptosporangium sp. NPDC006013]|uniref:hypothetical protein n=1 Tax=Streptosporangium sp. NPDC006013 TaxID=3155596 RepID=UPI0033B88DEA